MRRRNVLDTIITPIFINFTIGWRRNVKKMSDFQIEDGVLVKYRGKGRKVVIPDSVTAIGDGALWKCSSLTSITLPESVTSFGDSVFGVCSRLRSITLPDSVTSIGYMVFDECSSLTSITIPDSVTSIGG